MYQTGDFLPSRAGQVPPVRKAAADLTAATAPNDQVDLSPEGALLAQALTNSDARAEKVANLQQAITSGSYQVSSEEIADKLIGSLLK